MLVVDIYITPSLLVARSYFVYITTQLDTTKNMKYFDTYEIKTDASRTHIQAMYQMSDRLFICMKKCGAGRKREKIRQFGKFSHHVNLASSHCG